MFSFFKKKEVETRTLFDDFQQASSRVIVKGYRRIAGIHGIAPTSKTTDAKIMEIYRSVLSAFGEASKKRREELSALCLNHIVTKFYQVYEMYGEQKLHEHLKYEVSKYLAEGLRQDYKRELQLFNPNNLNDPDIRRVAELERLVREAIKRDTGRRYNSSLLAS